MVMLLLVSWYYYLWYHGDVIIGIIVMLLLGAWCYYYWYHGGILVGIR